MVTLVDLLQQLPVLNPNNIVLAAQPWTATSKAASVAGEVAEAEHASIEGLTYLLEVGLAIDVADVWSKWRAGSRPDPTELCEAVIYYAQHDAYLPVGER